jgi:ferrous iron transport protein B
MLNAGKVIVPMVLVLTFLNSWGTDGSFGNENTDKSVLSEIGRTITPLFEPMGIHEENWPATVGIFTGILAKEAVVGTLDAMYSQLAVSDAGNVTTEEEPISIWQGIINAFATIPANLAQLVEKLGDPLGLNIGDTSDRAKAAAEQEVSTNTFSAMQARFDGQVGAFAYLLFILLYFPCAAATATIYRETHVHWTLFVISWTTGMAYLMATTFYQLAKFEQHPTFSLIWLSSSFALGILLIWLMRLYGQRSQKLAVVGIS